MFEFRYNEVLYIECRADIVKCCALSVEQLSEVLYVECKAA